MFEPSEHGLIFLFLHYGVVLLLGLLFGSFTTAIVYRVPRDIPWAFSSKGSDGGKEVGDIGAYRSVCPECHTPLKVFDLVPVFSWLFLRGKCRYCGVSIPARYPLIELGVVVTALAAFAVLGVSMEFLFVLLALPFLWALLVIDLDHLILPNHLVAIVGVLGGLRLLFGYVFEGADDVFLYDRLAGFVLFPLFIWSLGWVMTKILKKDALGFGDVKFFAAAGLWIGVSSLAWFCMASGVMGIVFGVLWQRIKKENVFPFGPALIAALYVMILLENSDFYLLFKI